MTTPSCLRLILAPFLLTIHIQFFDNLQTLILCSTLTPATLVPAAISPAMA